MKSLAALASVLAVSFLLAACGGGGGKSTAKIAVGLKEWQVDVQPAEAKPGKVQFEVTNSGTRVHQFLVVKSDLPPGQLPTIDNLVDEGKLNVAGSVKAIQPGASSSVEMEL